MSIAAHDLRLLEHLMKEEAENLENLSVLEKKLRHSVMQREWANLDGVLRAVQNMSEKVSQTEKIRAVVYQKIKRSCQAKQEESFQEVLARLPVEERGDLSGLHRRVRVAVEKVKSLTGGLDTYISSVVSTLDKVLEEIIPDKRNKIYSQRGGFIDSSRPLMVSQSI